MAQQGIEIGKTCIGGLEIHFDHEDFLTAYVMVDGKLIRYSVTQIMYNHIKKDLKVRT